MRLTLAQLEAFYWAVETRQSLRPDDVSLRQFFCAVQIRPGKSTNVAGLSAKAPAHKVSADVLANDSERPGKIVINRVEYADGSVWQRPGWSLDGHPVPLLSGPTNTRVQGCIELHGSKLK